MADKKLLNKQIPSSITYPNPYAEGEVFTPSNVSIGQETIRKNIPLGLGMPQSPPRVPSAMPPQNVIRNAGIQMIPEEPSDDSSNFLGSLIAQGIAGIGTGLMGGDSYAIQRSASMFQGMRDKQENERKAKLYTDPKSEESKKRRLVFEKALGFKIPDEYSYTDLNDPVVLQSIRDKNMQAISPKGGAGTVGTGQAKQEKEKKLESKDYDEMGMINQLRNTTNDLSSSINQYGNAYFGGESSKQDTLKQNLAAIMGVLTGQGAMTESDIEFWNNKLKKAYGESPEDYANRLKDLQKNLVNKQINKLKNKGFDVEFHESSNKYYVYPKGNNLDPISEF